MNTTTNGKPLPFRRPATLRKPTPFGNSVPDCEGPRGRPFDQEDEMSDVEIGDAKEIPTHSERCETKMGEGTLEVLFDDIRNDLPWDESLRARIIFELDSEEEVEVGLIDLHIIDKTKAGPRGRKLWVPGLLRSGVTSELKTTSEALKSLYSTSGTLLKNTFKLTDAKLVADGLDTETIVYVGTIQLCKHYQGIGLGSVAMTVLDRMLRDRLGNDSYTMLLQPDRLQNNETASKDRETIQKSLIRFYERSGYRVWYRYEPGVSPTYTLMGKKM